MNNRTENFEILKNRTILIKWRFTENNRGAKLNKYVQWTNLNPTALLDEVKQMGFMFPFKTLEDYMKRSGITNAYQSKPCLDPQDAECPDTAPNKKSGQVRIEHYFEGEKKTESH